MTANEGRAQTLGDLLDRTLTLFGRSWRPLLAVLAVVAVPVAVLQYAAEPSMAHFFDIMGRAVALPPSATAERARLAGELSRSLPQAGWTAPYLFLAELTLFPLAQTAAFACAGAALAGGTPSVAGAYRAALPRWGAQMVVLIAFVVMACLLVVPFGIAVLVAAAIAYFFSALSSGLGGLAAVLLVGAIGATAVAAASAGYFAWLLASASVAGEDGSPRRAIESALRRVFDPALRGRTLVVAPVLLGVNWLATLTIVSLGSVVANVAHADALFVAIPALVALAIDGVRIVFVQVYLADVRYRREGGDLLAAAAGLPAGAADDGDVGSAAYALIDAFLERRETLSPAARAEIAARIAAVVRPRLRASFHYLDDVALLEHVSRTRG